MMVNDDSRQDRIAKERPVDEREAEVFGRGLVEAESFIDRKQGYAIEDMVKIAEQVAMKVPKLVVWLLGFGIGGNILTLAILLWCTSCGDEGKLLLAEHLKYLTIATIASVAIIVTGCTAGIKGVLAVLLKRMQSSETGAGKTEM